MRVAVVLLALLVLAPLASGEGTAHATYVSSGDLVTASDGTGTHVGGARFWPAETDRAVQVSVHDDVSGALVTVTVCQDLDLDLTCGESGEPVARGCGAATLDAMQKFDPRSEVVVFVQTASVTTPVAQVNGEGCGAPGLVTSGVITATFA